jgi:hypothetical protein
MPSPAVRPRSRTEGGLPGAEGRMRAFVSCPETRRMRHGRTIVLAMGGSLPV